MSMHKRLLGLVLGGALLLPVAASAADPKPMKLTPQDYIEIEQLSNKYSFAIDTCTNKGYDYADLYTADGEFGVAEEWGKPGRVFAKGRDALAKADGGGPDGCVDPKTMRGYGITHIIINVVITPTATGAVGRCKLLALGVGGNPTTIEQQGGYEDVYVKTKDGWRFKTRFHVFPNMANSVQFGKKKE
ncbi:MAG TPA: nuclear transport factor 2 family protein [Steroidobacteraceae bacterium]|nr:nuclear transport factor 2 family protein [Steroidobacteraceae bacterium]